MFVDLLGGVHWLGAIVAALVWFALGAAWYIAPPIAAAWQRAGGIEIDEDARPNPKVFLFTLIAYFVACVAISAIVTAVGASSIVDGASVGLLVGIGFALTAAAVSSIYDQKPEPLTYFLINGFFNTVALTVVGGVLGAFAQHLIGPER